MIPNPWPGTFDGAATDTLRLPSHSGDIVEFPMSRWLGAVDDEEVGVLQRAVGPVLDIGCGPGRHVSWLIARGVLALGIDVAPAPLRIASNRGAFVLQQSVFEGVPAPGCWTTALLLDGSIGIGGAPDVLLRRVRELVTSGGRLLVEVEPPGTGLRSIRLRGHLGWFEWAHVGVDVLADLAHASGWEIAEIWKGEQRWFADLATL
jgi:SAM-dependent methyltransferase